MRQSHVGAAKQHLNQERTNRDQKAQNQQQRLGLGAPMAQDIGGNKTDERDAKNCAHLDESENAASFPRRKQVIRQRPAHHRTHHAVSLHPDINKIID